MFCVTEMLDFLEDYVAILYKSKLSERYLEDEFDVEHVISTRSPEDTNFYKRVFLPAAIIFTYQDRHPNSDLRPLLNDVFTLGSGSKTKSLFPETNAVCLECVSKYFPQLKGVESQIENLNIQVFMEQKSNLFLRPKFAKFLKKMHLTDTNRDSDIAEDKNKASRVSQPPEQCTGVVSTVQTATEHLQSVDNQSNHNESMSKRQKASPPDDAPEVSTRLVTSSFDTIPVYPPAKPKSCNLVTGSTLPLNNLSSSIVCPYSSKAGAIMGLNLSSSKDTGEEMECSDENYSDVHFNPFSDGSSSRVSESAALELISNELFNENFNPFSSDESASESNLLPHKCDPCDKGFSKEEYLKYHHNIFHSKEETKSKERKVLAPVFVSEGEELMESFIRPDIAADQETPIKEIIESSSSKKIHRFNLRKKANTKKVLVFE